MPVVDNTSGPLNTAFGLGVTDLETGSWAISGSDRLLLAQLSWAMSSPLEDWSYLKWDGASGTNLTTISDIEEGPGWNVRSIVGKLVAPASGSRTLAAGWLGTVDEAVLGGISFTGVHQSTPHGTVAEASNIDTGSPVTASVVVSSAVGELVVSAAAATRTATVGALDVTAGSGQTQQWEVEGLGSGTAATQSVEDGAASVTMSENFVPGSSVTIAWVIAGISLKPAVNVTGVPGGGGGSFGAWSESPWSAVPVVAAGNDEITGTSAGAATVTGVGRMKAKGAGSAAGAATVSGVGRMKFKGAGSSAGTSTVAGDGQAKNKAAGSATGAATVSGVGRMKARGAGSSAGAATATGTIQDNNAGASTGTAAGTSTATAVGRARAKAAGSSAGMSTAAAVGRARIDAPGTATAAATVSGVGRMKARGTGSAIGGTTVAGVGRVIGRVFGVGSAAGVATATGVIRNKNEILQPTTGGTKWPSKLWMPPKKKPKIVRGTGLAVGRSTAVGVGRVIWMQRAAGAAHAKAKTAATGRASYDAYNARRIAEFLDMLRTVDF